MNHMMIESLKQTLALMREREEKCRDVALAIQRMLEAEGAMYAQMVGRGTLSAVVAPVVKAAPAGAAAGTGPEKAAEKNGPRTWPKTCTICGTKFDARSASAKCCCRACVDEKNRRYANAKYLEKKPAAKPTVKKAAATVGKEKACAACGKAFTPWRSDQKCCSTKCGQSSKAPAARKPPAVANKAPVDGPAPVTRVDRIRAAVARLDGLPQSAIDAAREAAESDGAR
jgi:hypothetical protein